MVYVGLHVKRIAADLGETLESQAEIFPATWAAVLDVEKAIAEEMPAQPPKRKQGYEGKPRRCVWSKAEQIKRLQYQARYIRRTRKVAEAKIKDAARGKEEGKVQWMRVPWLVRVEL